MIKESAINFLRNKKEYGKSCQLYWLFGDNDFFLIECKNYIQDILSHPQKILMKPSTNDDEPWHKLENDLRHSSLFDDRADIDIYLPKKLTPLAIKILSRVFIDGKRNENWIIYSIAEPSKILGLKSSLHKDVCLIDLNINPKEFTSWAQWSILSKNIKLQEDAKQWLLENCHQNFLKLNQSLMILSLLEKDTRLSLEDVSKSCGFEADYSTFELIDSILTKDTIKSQKILYTIENKGTEPLIILWYLNSELKKILSLYDKSDKELQLEFKKLNIWSSKQAMFINFTRKTKLSIIQEATCEIAALDKLAKLSQKAELWCRLRYLLYNICEK